MKAGVVLSGCGVYDGSEIYETVLTLLALAEHKAEVVCMAPDMEQMHVVDHLSGNAGREKRNVLIEAARLARGEAANIRDIKAETLDMLIFPGGFGAAKNLCTFAVDGAGCGVNGDVESLAQAVHEAGRPIGAMCIAPALVARIFKGRGLNLTVGRDADVAQAIETLGHKHIECGVDEICVDETARIVTTPAYMLAGNILEARSGIDKLVGKVIELAVEGRS